MASVAFAPARRAALAAAIVGALALLLVPMVRAQEASAGLPDSVRTAVIAAAATQAGVPEADVEILRTEAVTWNDGCLGVQQTGEACTQALVDGFVVWVLAGGEVHRIHTDTQSQVRLAESGIATSAVAGASLPTGATARQTGGEPTSIVSGDIPTSGFALFTVNTQASTMQVRTALAAEGCTAETLAKAVDGTWYIYGFDSPSFVNDRFFQADSSQSGMIAADTILLTNCVTGGTTPTPTPTGTATPTPTGTMTPTPTPTGTTTPDGFSTTSVDQTSRTGAGVLQNVAVGEHVGYERIVFQFGSTLNGGPQLAAGVPAYSVGYQENPTACGSGAPVTVNGDAMLVVTLPGTFSYDPNTGQQFATEPSLEQVQSIQGVDQSCAFEGNSTWVFGIDSEAGFRISELSNPTRLVIDVQTDDGTATPTPTP